MRRARYQETLRQVLSLPGLQTAEIDRIAEGARQFLVALARIPQIRDKDAGACGALLAQIRENDRAHRALLAADAEGSVVCSSIGPGPPIGDQAYFRMAARTGDLATGEHAMGRGTGLAAIHFSYPLRKSDGGIGDCQRLYRPAPGRPNRGHIGCQSRGDVTRSSP